MANASPKALCVRVKSPFPPPDQNEFLDAQEILQRVMRNVAPTDGRVELRADRLARAIQTTAKDVIPPKSVGPAAACAAIATFVETGLLTVHETSAGMIGVYSCGETPSPEQRPRACTIQPDEYHTFAVRAEPALWKWSRKGEVRRGADAGRADESTAHASGKPATINQRMLDTMQKKLESREWSAQQWATHLGCSKSTVAETDAWKSLNAVKGGVALGRLAESAGQETRRRNRRS